MKRFALMLATLAILCVGAAQAQAHGYHHGHGGYHGGFYGPAVVYPRVWAPPVVVVPPRVYPPVYDYRYYAPRPSTGFYYRGPGVSIGVGF
jgi:hypothetical protein